MIIAIRLFVLPALLSSGSVVSADPRRTSWSFYMGEKKYIYIQRERERQDKNSFSLYIYIYRETEREREKLFQSCLFCHDVLFCLVDCSFARTSAVFTAAPIRVIVTVLIIKRIIIIIICIITTNNNTLRITIAIIVIISHTNNACYHSDMINNSTHLGGLHRGAREGRGSAGRRAL